MLNLPCNGSSVRAKRLRSRNIGHFTVELHVFITPNLKDVGTEPTTYPNGLAPAEKIYEAFEFCLARSAGTKPISTEGAVVTRLGGRVVGSNPATSSMSVLNATRVPLTRKALPASRQSADLYFGPDESGLKGYISSCVRIYSVRRPYSCSVWR